MIKYLLNRQSRRKTEKPGVPDWLCRKERIRHHAIPSNINAKNNYDHKWKKLIIQTRLVKALVGMHSNAISSTLTQKLSLLNSILSGIVDDYQCNTILISSNRSNNSNHSEITTKELQYAFA